MPKEPARKFLCVWGAPPFSEKCSLSDPVCLVHWCVPVDENCLLFEGFRVTTLFLDVKERRVGRAQFPTEGCYEPPIFVVPGRSWLCGNRQMCAMECSGSA
jgi:hypothetical protein